MRLIALALLVISVAACANNREGVPPASFLKGRETVEVGTVDYDGKLVPLLMHIKYPDGPGPFPAVIYSGGCDGWDALGSAYMPDQVSWLEGRGYAVAMVDSLGSRKVIDTCSIHASSTKFIRSGDRATDDQLALWSLQQNPRTIPDRIGLFGFSAGGGGAVLAAKTEPVQYRAIFAIYGTCSPDSRPIIHNFQYVAGSDDNEATPEICQRYRKAPGKEVVIHLYPGVHHGYMLPQLDRGHQVMRGYGKVVYVEYDKAAHDDTIKRVQQWFDKYLLDK